jgi:hypothetical protein
MTKVCLLTKIEVHAHARLGCRLGANTGAQNDHIISNKPARTGNPTSKRSDSANVPLLYVCVGCICLVDLVLTVCILSCSLAKCLPMKYEKFCRW